MKRFQKFDNQTNSLIELYRCLRNFDKLASKKFNVHRYILAYIIRNSGKIDFYPDLSFFVDDILSYQEQGGNTNEQGIFKFDNKNFKLDIIKKYLPEAIINTIAYRTILLNKKDLDKNNLESIKNNIYKNDIESWTLDKNYADNLENSLLQDQYNNSKVPIRMVSKIEGISLPIFWRTLKKKYFDNEEEFNSRFYEVDQDYAHENEVFDSSITWTFYDDIMIISRADPQTVLHFINLDTWEEETCASGVLGYDRTNNRIISSETKDGKISVGYFKRYQIDELMEKGQKALNGATLSDEERYMYGLPIRGAVGEETDR